MTRIILFLSVLELKLISSSTQPLKIFDQLVVFNNSIGIPQIPPFHITIVAHSVEFIHLFLSHQSNLAMPVTILRRDDSSNIHQLHSTTMFPPSERRKRQIRTNSYRQLKSTIVVIEVSDNLEALISHLQQSVYWNSRAHTFLVDMKTSISSAKSALLLAFNFNMYNTAYLRGKTAIIYNPFSSADEAIFTALSPSDWVWSSLFPPKFKNLNGQTLRVSTFPHPPMVMQDQHGTWSGLEIEILNAFQIALNFSYNITGPSDGAKWGYKISATNWTGLYGQVIHNKVEFGFANLFIYGEKNYLFQQTFPYDQDATCWAVPNPIGIHQDWLGIVKAFSSTVWVIIIVGIIGFMVIVELLHKRTDVFLENRGSWLLTFGTFLGVSIDILPTRSTGRILWTFWMVLGLLITSTYKGGLISKLALPTQMRPINTANELAKSKLTVEGYIGLKWALQYPPSPVLSRFKNIENIEEALERVAIKKTAALMESKKWILFMREKLYSDNFGNNLVHVARKCPAHFNIGFISPVDSKYFWTFNRFMMYVLESGLVQKWYNDVLRQAKKGGSSDSKLGLVNYIEDDDTISSVDEKTILSLTHLRSAFIILFLGHSLSALIFLLELYTKRFQELLIS